MALVVQAILRKGLAFVIRPRPTCQVNRNLLKLADSLHLAAAVESGCDRFLTNDARLSAFTAIPVEVLP